MQSCKRIEIATTATLQTNQQPDNIKTEAASLHKTKTKTKTYSAFCFLTLFLGQQPASHIIEKFWYHTQLHNFVHNSPMWQVVVGEGAFPYGPTITITPPPTTTRHMDELCNWVWHQNWHQNFSA